MVCNKITKSIEVNCSICGKPIIIVPSRYNKSLSKIFTCSFKCSVINKITKNKTDTCALCGKKFHSRSRHAKNKCCSRECMGKLRRSIYLGKNNPNRKYPYDENFLENIDSEFKAWLLGWIASDGNISKGTISISIHKKDVDVLETIRDNFCKEIPIRKKHLVPMVTIRISSKKMVSDVLRHLNLKKYGEKHSSLESVNIPKEFIIPFVRGVFEGDGHLSLDENKKYPKCGISSNSKEFLEYIKDSMEIPSKIDDYVKNKSLRYLGVNAIDFVGKIYQNSNYRMERKYFKYLEACMWEPMISNIKNNHNIIDKIRFSKTDSEAVLPSKGHTSDSGYDLTLIKVDKKIGDVILYNTGIKIKPPFGYYFDLVPRSSIIKSGYVLANSIGIIDRSYLGAIKVPLIKLDKSKPDLELPSKLVQLIPRKIVHMELEEVFDLEETSRNEGGFGSTNKEVS